LLVICNGAFKSGSTWLFRIVKLLIPGKPIPPEFHSTAEWKGMSIAKKKLSKFLEKVDYKNENYVCKAHYNDVKIRSLLLKFDDVYILNIKRDIRDVITSAYYHYNRRNGVKWTFDEFYWRKGRNLVGYISEYHNIWYPIEGKIYVSSYQGLYQDFDKEVRRICNFLNYYLKPGELGHLKEKTSLEIFRKSWKEESSPPEKRFFRKGIIGDWKNHFTPGIEADFNKMSREAQLKKTVIKKMNRFIRNKIRGLKKRLSKKGDGFPTW